MLLGILFLTQVHLHATHIVGGELNYTHLQGDQYEIKLTIFRDCYNANPNVFFDDTVSIGVFNPISLELFEDIRIPYDSLLNDTLSPVLYNDCLVIPPDVCVHTTFYKDTINLPYQEDGYVLTYQRCCRNGTINNIINPLETGATFSVFISPQALAYNNSNPKFQSWPPIYICSGFPIYYDQSAIDVDGDSIAYKLCTPLTGGGLAPNGNPKPQPPAPPPYEPVVWQDPPYNEDNMLNAFPGPVLTIDPITGFLSGTPNTIGQFVVGICIEEFRFGELISTTRRDFQYNVGLCESPAAAFFSPETICTSDSILFDNQSTNTSNFLWSFDALNNPDWTSSETNPSFLYPAYGEYLVQLISEPFTICADTFQQDITVLPTGLIPSIDYNFISCGDIFEIDFQSNITSLGSTPIDYTWYFSNGQTIFAENPTVFFNNDVTFLEVTLEVTGSEGCIYEAYETLYLNTIDEDIELDSLTICEGESVFLNPVYSLDYTYSWTPNQNISNPYSPNPQVSPTEDTFYEVVIADNQGCTKTASVWIDVNQSPSLAIPSDTIICDTVVTIPVQTNATDYYWSTTADFQDTLLVNQTLFISVIDSASYYISAQSDINECLVLDSIVIYSEAIIQEEELPTFLGCIGESYSINHADNLSNFDSVDYDFSFAYPIIADNEQISFYATQVGWDTIFLTYFNAANCQKNAFIPFYLSDGSSLPAISSDDCEGLTRTFEIDENLQAFSLWDFGDNTGIYTFEADEIILHDYVAEGNYLVQYWIPDLIECTDTVSLSIDVTNNPVDLSIEVTPVDCTQGIFQLELGIEDINLIDSLVWTIDSNTFTSPITEISVIDSSLITLNIFLPNGCQEILNYSLNRPVESDFSFDTLSICPGDSVMLTKNLDVNQEIAWTGNLITGVLSSETIVLYPDVSGYVLTEVLTNYNAGSCSYYDSIYIAVNALVQPVLNLSNQDCNETIEVSMDNVDPTNSPIWIVNQDSIITPILSLNSNAYAGDYIYGWSNIPGACNSLDSLLIPGLAPPFPDDTLFIPCYPNESTLTWEDHPSAEISWNTFGTDLSYNNEVFTFPFATNSYYEIYQEDILDCIDTLEVYVNGSTALLGLELLTNADTILLGDSLIVFANITDLSYYQFEYEQEVLEGTDYIMGILPNGDGQVNLLAMDSLGCMDEVFVNFVVLDPKCTFPFVYFPNTFTPNNDGENDLFKVEGNFITELELYIYDRWGELVFFSDDPNDGWDGTYKGVDLDSDTYAYYANIVCIGGLKSTEQGNITLIR